MDSQEQARLDELKAIGFVKLKGDERIEYQKLMRKSASQASEEQEQKITEIRNANIAEQEAEGKLKPAEKPVEKVSMPEVDPALKKLIGQPSGAAAPNAAQPAKDESVIVSRSQLEQMISDAIAKDRVRTGANLNPNNTGFREYVEPPKAKPMATIRKWRESGDDPWGLMVKVQHMKWEWDEESRKYDKDIYRFTFLMPDGKLKPVDMPYFNLVKMNEVEMVKIIKMDKKKFVASQGWTRKGVVKHNDVVYGDPLGDRVPLEVFKDEYPDGALVELEDGRQVTVPVSCLNA